MIPQNILKNHIEKAIERIDKEGYSSIRNSKKYSLLFKNKEYPPKLVISIANEYANGKNLLSSSFNGGNETNNFLKKRGFTIRVKGQTIQKSRIQEKRPFSIKKTGHSQRCPECKKVIEQMLRKIYGDILKNHKISAGTKPSDYANTRIYASLLEIYSELQGYRGNRDFVKSPNLPNVDFYIPNPGFIVEVDESQHFTALRKLALSHYPKVVDYGFNREKWLKLCDEIRASDNDPIYRDEQRAWYDTLRDFIPLVNGQQLTRRIYIKDYRWCELDPEDINDQRTFKRFLLNKEILTVRADKNPNFARIIISGDGPCENTQAKKLLDMACNEWPMNSKVKFLVTPGGFLTFEWPNEITRTFDNKEPPEAIITKLIKLGQRACEMIFDEQFQKRLGAFADYIAIGIDSRKSKISISNAQIGNLHAEMIALLDLKTEEYYWSGKSFPTFGQQEGLVRFNDISTHFIDTSYGKLMYLGCHDLSIFSPRGTVTAKAKWKRDIREQFIENAQNEKPAIVIQHPHTTDSLLTWTQSWDNLIRQLPTVNQYISSGRYFDSNGHQRSNIDEVLNCTKMGNSIDFIFNI